MVATANTPLTASILATNLDCRIATTDLKRAVASLVRIADKRSTMPMLAHVLVKVAPNELTLAATDLNVSAVVTMAVKSDSDGAVCVNAKALADLVKSLSGDEVRLTQTGGTGLRVFDGQSDISMIGLHSRDFPKIPTVSDDAILSGAVVFHPTVAVAFADMLQRVAYSICKDDTRFHLNGIRIECTGTTTRMVTTDGHRLTRHDAPLTGAPTQGVILPAKAATEIAKICAAHKGFECTVAYDKHLMFVRVGGWSIAAKLIDAQFPAYEQVIPKDNAKLATVERKPLIVALKRAAKLCTQTRGVKLSLASGKLTLTSDHPETGTATESLKADSQWLECGGTGHWGVNATYLLETLGEIGDRHVTIAFGAELDPMLVRGTDDAVSYSVAGSQFLGVIMPMRI